MTRVVRSSFNFLSTAAFSAVTLVTALVATPLLLRWLGEEQFGAVRAMADWAGYLALLELGLGGALMPMLARALTDGRAGHVGGVMAAGFRAYRRATAVMVIGAAVLIAMIPLVVPVSSALEVRDLRIAMCVLAGGLLFVPLVPLRAMWEADQRGYVVNVLLTLQAVLVAALALVLAWLLAARGFGITGQAIAVVGGLAAYNAALALLTWRRRPDALRAFASRCGADVDAQLWRLNWPTLALTIAGRVSLLTDNIIIAYFLGPAAVVPFFITQRLAQLAQGQLQAVGSATWAGMVDLRSDPNGEELFRRRLIEITQLLLVLGVAVLVPIAAFNERFVGLWVGDEQFGGPMLTWLACGNAMLLAVLSFWGWMFTGTGQVGRLVAPMLVSCGINVCASIALTVMLRSSRPELALLGPLLGTTMAFVSVNLWWMTLLLHRTFGVRPRDVVLAIAKPLLVGLCFGAGLFVWARRHGPTGWSSLVAQMGIAALIGLFLGWWLVLQKETRAMWMHRFRLVAGTGRPGGATTPDEASTERDGESA